MIKTVETSEGKEIKLASSGAFLYIYRNQFGLDPFKDLFGMVEKVRGNYDEDGQLIDGVDMFELMKSIDVYTLQNIAWALAKNANKDVKEPIEFYHDNPDFLPMDHMSEIIDLAMGSMTTTEQPKNE